MHVKSLASNDAGENSQLELDKARERWAHNVFVTFPKKNVIKNCNAHMKLKYPQIKPDEHI